MRGKITAPCAYCRNIIFRNASFKDEGEFEALCPHCKKMNLVKISVEIQVAVRPVDDLLFDKTNCGIIEVQLKSK